MRGARQDLQSQAPGGAGRLRGLRLEKPRRVRDRRFLDSLQGQPCVICGKPGEPAHLKSRAAGGDDTKENVKSLCHPHHAEFHQMGRYSFCEKYHLDWFN